MRLYVHILHHPSIEFDSIATCPDALNDFPESDSWTYWYSHVDATLNFV